MGMLVVTTILSRSNVRFNGMPDGAEAIAGPRLRQSERERFLCHPEQSGSFVRNRPDGIGPGRIAAPGRKIAG